MGQWVHRLSNLNEKKKTATCAHCGKVKIVWKARWRCSIAVNETGGSRYKSQRKGRVAPDRCEICGLVGPVVSDHDHATNKFRGWLCRACNLGLGCFKDDVAIMEEARRYLTLHT